MKEMNIITYILENLKKINNIEKHKNETENETRKKNDKKCLKTVIKIKKKEHEEMFEKGMKKN